VIVDDEIESNDPKYSEFESEWEVAIETMSEILDLINESSDGDEDSDDDAQMRFDSILDSYGFTDYAPELTATMAFVDLVPCDVGEERAGGLGGMGLSLEKTIFLKNSDKIDIGITKIRDLVTELNERFLDE
jgi:hypothetical protein